jgi:hypothetical protein
MMRTFAAANDNRPPPPPEITPLEIELAAVHIMECIWRVLHGQYEGPTRLDARRDRRAIQRMREDVYRRWLRGRA